MKHGFRLIEERFIKEINSMARLYIHEKSGARLFHIENEDDNKVFSISFKTPPEDNTGLTHILEHSVLCGSRKFPTKEPFLDLAKGSLNTFLNALTFADKTMYPVASKNNKDFMNLIDVYLDAVFYPKIYECPEIFMQEGWHYDISKADEDITYKGVVYNEMLGAFSSPEEILMSKAMESLYPDTSYGFESGGDPKHIPRLKHNQFLEYHKKYYHPSNSYIYLYGNGDIAEQLRFLDMEYLNAFDKKDAECNLIIQKPFLKPTEDIIYYPVSSKDEEMDGTYFCRSYVTGNACDAELSIAFDILEYILLETPASPLKKALIDAEIGKDVIGNFNEGLLQPMFSIVLKDSNENEKNKFIDIIDKSLRDLVKNKVDKKIIEASINSMEFKFREAEGDDTPRGILFGVRCMDSWLYSEDPFLHLEYEATLNVIKDKAYDNYFEDLIEKYLINNPHSSHLTLVPRFGLAEERADVMRSELQEYKRSLTENELSKLIDDNRKLSERQLKPDSDENLEKIPLISLKDISPLVTMPPLEIREECGVDILYHNVFTNQIVYFDLLFDTSAVDREILPYMSLLSDVMGMVKTTKLSYGEISNEIDIHTGGIDFNVEVYEEVSSKKFHPKFIVESKALAHKLPHLIELLNDIINDSIFNDKKRLKEIIQETKSDLEMELMDDGHAVAAKRLCSYFSTHAYYIEILTGISYYNFICELEDNFNKKFNEIVKNLERVRQIIFNKSNLIVSLTCQEEEYKQFKEVFPQFVDKLHDEKSESVDYETPYFSKNEGFYTSGNVQYVAKGYNYRDLGYSYSGHMQVLKNILSLDYLWNRVRVQGGAYGTFARFEMSGNMYFVSYRDPNLMETITIYDEIESYINEFDVNEREMQKYIIGTINDFDQPLTPSQVSQRADEFYFRKITEEDMQRERDEVLKTKPGDIRKFTKMILDAMGKDYICVVGSERKIKENIKRFNKVISVFE